MLATTDFHEFFLRTYSKVLAKVLGVRLVNRHQILLKEPMEDRGLVRRLGV